MTDVYDDMYGDIILYILVRGLSGVRFCLLQTDIGRHEVHLPINNKDYNFREAQEIKILLGFYHVGIQGTRSLTTLKIIS